MYRSSLLVLAAVLVAGCALFRGAARATSYGAELASCEAESLTWVAYTPCCVTVNSRYPLPNGGRRDTSLCYMPDGGTHVGP